MAPISERFEMEFIFITKNHVSVNHINVCAVLEFLFEVLYNVH